MNAEHGRRRPIRCSRRRSAFLRMLNVLVPLLVVAGTSTFAVSTPSRRICNPDRIKQTNAWVECLQTALDQSQAKLEATAGKSEAAR